MNILPKFSSLFIIIVFLVTISKVCNAQNPTYELYVTNESQIDSKTYQFDVYLLRTGSVPLELSYLQFGLGFDTSIVNGGTVSCTIVPNSSQLNTVQVPNNITIGSNAQTNTVGGVVYRYINQLARSLPGTGNGTIISYLKTGCSSPGTRIGTYRLTNTVDFKKNSRCKHLFNATAAAGRTNTALSAYVNNVSTTITGTNFSYSSTNTCDQNILLNSCSLLASVSNILASDCFTSSTGSATVLLSGIFGVSSSGTYRIDNANSLDSFSFNSNPFTVTSLSGGTHVFFINSSVGNCSASTGNFTIPISGLASSFTASGCGSYLLPWDSTVTTDGTYEHHYTTQSGCDSLVSAIITIKTPPVNNLIISDTIKVCGDSYHLAAPFGFDNYSWSTGEASDAIDVSENGWYSCTANRGVCYLTDSVLINFQNPIFLSNDTTICRGTSISLNANEVNNPFGAKVIYNENFENTGISGWSNQRFFSFDGSQVMGPYSNESVSYQKSNLITHDSVLVDFDFYPHDSWDYGEPFQFSIDNNPFATVYFSLGGYTSDSRFVRQYNVPNRCWYGGGSMIKYHLSVKLPHSSGSIYFNINQWGGQDMCDESWSFDNFKLTLLNTNTYLWSNGSTTSNITVNPFAAETFYCTKNNGITSCTDSVKININSFHPDLFTIDTTSVCASTTELNAGTGYNSYQWNTGFTDQIINTSNTGWYSCTVNDGMCNSTDSIYLSIINPDFLNNDTTICRGNSVQLIANLTNSQPGNNQNIVSNGNFESSNYDGFSNVKPWWYDGSQIMGPYSNESFSYQTSNLDPHDSVYVEFDFYTFDSWDGDEPFQFSLNNIPFTTAYFNYNAWTSDNRFILVSNLSGRCWWPYYYYYSRKYHAKFKVPHNSSSLNFSVNQWSGEGMCNESWAFDNLNIRPIKKYTCKWFNDDTTSSLTIRPAQDSTYSCFISNGVSSCKDSVKVNIIAPPVITQQPNDITLCVGSSNTFAVKAQGNNLNYQWQLSTDGGVNFQDIYGATDTIYSVSNVSIYQNGYKYRVVISSTNCAANPISNAATLFVTQTPTITAQPRSVSLCENSSYSLSVDLSNAEHVIYQWQWSTDGGSTFQNINGANDKNYYISKTTLNLSASRYRVIIKNTYCANEVVSDAATISITPIPKILSQPTDIVVSPGGNGTLKASVTGELLKLQWQISTDSGRTFNDISGATDSIYTLHNPDPNDTNNKYRISITGKCSVNNKYDGIYEATGSMRDVTPDGINRNYRGRYPYNYYVIDNDSLGVTFNSYYNGTIAPSYYYRYDVTEWRSYYYWCYWCGGYWYTYTVENVYPEFGIQAFFDKTNNKISKVRNYYGNPDNPSTSIGNTNGSGSPDFFSSNGTGALLDSSGINEYDSLARTIKIEYFMMQPNMISNGPRTYFDETLRYLGPRDQGKFLPINSNKVRFTLLQEPPVISSILPLKICTPSATVTIKGKNFTDASSLKIQGFDVPYTVINDTIIKMFTNSSTVSGDITIVNAIGSTTSDSNFIVSNLSSFTLAPNPNPFKLCGGTPRKLTTNLPNIYSYTCSNGQSGNNIMINSAGNYTLTATDASGCSITSNFSVTNYSSCGGYLEIESDSLVNYFDTLTIRVKIKNGVNIFSVFAYLNYDMNQLRYLSSNVGDFLGSNIIFQPAVVSNGHVDFGMSKYRGASGSYGDGLIYEFKFVLNDQVFSSTAFNNANANFINTTVSLSNLSVYNNLGTKPPSFAAISMLSKSIACRYFVPVWSGDLNADGIVNTADLLPIGYYYGKTGPARPYGSLNWNAQPAALWDFDKTTHYASAFEVFADGNADGIINLADQAAIGYNFGLTNFSQSIINNGVNNVPGFMPNSSNNIITAGTSMVSNTSQFPQLSVNINDTLLEQAYLPKNEKVTISAGSVNNPITDLYGLSFNIYFDPANVDLSNIRISYVGSIFGTLNTDFVKIEDRSKVDQGIISIGITRYNNTPVYAVGGTVVNLSLPILQTANSGWAKVTVVPNAANEKIGKPITLIGGVDSVNILSFIPLNVKAFIEGFYNSMNIMPSTIFDLGLTNDQSVTDSIELSMWSPTNLNSNKPEFTKKALLHTNGNININIPYSFLGKSYYLALKHRNSIEAWSSIPVYISTNTNYNFTNSSNAAFSDGFNSPLKQMNNGVYAIYSGDINQDGTADAIDLQITENDAYNFTFGYNASDCNGDGASDAMDMQIIENNGALFLFMARPY